jgi:tRNA(adenine34) deaminase
MENLFQEYRKYMSEAYGEALKSLESGDVPIGCVIVRNGEIVGRGFNKVVLLASPLAHAEIGAINEAILSTGYKHLLDCALYVTLEPCPMCAGAIVLARIPTLVIGATDPKTGACGSVFNIASNNRLNHRCNIISGIMEDECSALLKNFFKKLRG